MAEGSLTRPHTPPTHQHVVAAAEREIRACGRVGYLLSENFPLVGRSSRGNSKGGVANRKQCRQKSRHKFFPVAEVI